MSIDTLKIYKDCLESGHSEEQSLLFAKQTDNMFNQFKEEFASNRMMALMISTVIFMSSVIIGIGGFTLNKVIDLDKRVAILEHDVTVYINKK